MPKYTRTIDQTVELPDLGLTVNFGDVVDLPDDFFSDSDQALAIGFTLVPDQSKGVDHADSK